MSSNLNRLMIAIATVATSCGAFADTTSFEVDASVAKACVVGSPTAMNFGTLSLLDASTGKVVTGGNADASATFSTACTNGATGVTYSFTGTAGTGFVLAGDTDSINYSLFSDSTRLAGITRAAEVEGGDFATFAADGTNKTLSVYGRIALAANAAKPVGAYADIVTVTVTYAE